MNSELELVIATRHGKQSWGAGLSEVGIEQAESLADAIAELLLLEQTVAVFSSPEARAVETAEIIAETLKVAYQVCDKLKYDEYSDGVEIMTELLSVVGVHQVLIAVTHSSAPSGIINAFSMRYFQKKVHKERAGNGDGCMLCLKTGKVTSRLV